METILDTISDKIKKSNTMIPDTLEAPIPDFKQTIAQEYDFGFGDMITGALQKDSIPVQLGQRLNNNFANYKFTEDKTFNDAAKKEYFETNELGSVIREDLRDSLFSRAKSKEHFESLTSYYKEQSAKLDYLEEQGIGTQFLLGGLAEATNLPLYLGAAALAPASATVLASTAATRFVVGATAGLVLEGIKDIVGEADKTAIDYAMAVGIDGSLAAAIGKRTLKMKDLAKDTIFQAAGITEKVLLQIKAAPTDEAKTSIIKQAYFAKTGSEVKQSTLDNLQKKAKFATNSLSKRMWEAGRQDLEYITKNSESGTMSSFARSMFHDATLQNVDLNKEDLASLANIIEDRMRGQRKTIMNPLVKEYNRIVYNSGGMLGIKPSPRAESELSRLMGEIQMLRDMRNIDTDTAIQMSLDKYKIAATDEMKTLLQKSAKDMEKLVTGYRDLLGEYKNSLFVKNKDGYTQVPKNSTYMPYVYDKSIFAELRTAGLSSKQITKFFENSFISALNKKGAEYNPSDIRAIATFFYKSVTNSNVNSKNTFGGAIEDLRANANLTEGQRETLAQLEKDYEFTKPEENQGVYGRQRSKLDYTYTENFQLPNGAEIELSFDKFMSKDFDGIMDNYARRMAGSTALQRYSFTQQPKRLTSAQALEQVLKDPEVVNLMKEIDNIKLNILKQEDVDLLNSLYSDIAKQLDKRTKLGKQISKAIETEDVFEIAKLLSDNFEQIAKTLDKGKVAKTAELIGKVLSYNSKSLDSLLNSLDALKLSKSTEAIKESITPKKRTLSTTEDFVAFENQVRNELGKKVEEGVMSKKEASKELVRLRTIIKDMLGTPTSKEPDSAWNRAYRIIHTYNVGRLLGQTFFTMPAEAINIAYDTGLRNMMDNMPALKDLISAYKSGTIKNQQVQEIQDFMGIYNEFLSSSKQYEFEHDYSALTGSQKSVGKKVVDKVEQWGENFAEFTIMTGGIKPLTAWFQTSHIVGVFNKMKDVANGGQVNENYTKLLRELGLSDDMAGEIYKEILKNADGNLMNFGKWDADIKNIFLLGVKRRTDTLVQQQRLGDKMSWVVGENDYMFKDTVVGKFAMELKQFVLTSYTKQLGRAINRKDMYIVGLMASQALALTLSYTAKQYYNYAGDPQGLKDQMSPSKIVAGSLGMMPQASVIPELLNLGSNVFTGENIIGQTRNSGFGTNMFSSLPSVDLANKVIESFAIPFEVATGNADKNTLDPIFGLTGVKNSVLTRPFYQAATAEE